MFKRVNLPTGFCSNSHNHKQNVSLTHVLVFCSWNYCYFILVVSGLCSWKKNTKHLVELVNRLSWELMMFNPM